MKHGNLLRSKGGKRRSNSCSDLPTKPLQEGPQGAPLLNKSFGGQGENGLKPSPEDLQSMVGGRKLQMVHAQVLRSDSYCPQLTDYEHNSTKSNHLEKPVREATTSTNTAAGSDWKHFPKGSWTYSFPLPPSVTPL